MDTDIPPPPPPPQLKSKRGRKKGIPNKKNRTPEEKLVAPAPIETAPCSSMVKYSLKQTKESMNRQVSHTSKILNHQRLLAMRQVPNETL